VGGLYGNLKLCTAHLNIIPVHVHVEEHQIPPENLEDLNNRLVLAFGGRPRLAKNILQKVLRQWASRSPEIMGTVKKLVSGAHRCIETIQRKDYKDLGTLLDDYWTLKKAMAGDNSGVEPTEVRTIFDTLKRENIIDGCTLAGAGGGGFMVLLLCEGKDVDDAKEVLEQSKDVDEHLVTFYYCKVSNEGLESFTSDTSEFQIQWHMPNVDSK